jgi:hypothetical protein
MGNLKIKKRFMIIRNKVGKLKFNIIFRYQGDGIEKDSVYEKTKWKEKKLGIWWKRYTAVGERKNNPGLMFGLNLIWANLWFDISYGVKTFNIKEK